MTEHVKLDLFYAIEIAAEAIAKEAGVDWETADVMQKLKIREISVAAVRAAALPIVAQVLAELSGRTYEI